VRDIPIPAVGIFITAAITPAATCVTPLPIGNAPIAAGDIPIDSRITHIDP